MNDYLLDDSSLLIIKPEIVDHHSKVVESLKRRGFEVAQTPRLAFGWRAVARALYSLDSRLGSDTRLNPRQVDDLVLGYDLHEFPDYFYILPALSHPKGNTLLQLVAEKGDRIAYQEEQRSLRGTFGRDKKFNITSGGLVLTYNGIHCPNTSAALACHREILASHLR